MSKNRVRPEAGDDRWITQGKMLPVNGDGLK